MFINLLIVANAAPSGAGIRNNDESPTIVNSTIADNIGSGISSRKGSAPVLVNTVVWGNTGGSFSGQTAHLTTATYSVIEGGYPGTGNLNVDPLFVNPAANDYHLTTNSPLIDAGDSAHPMVPANDLDGNPRDIGAVDIGAYEFGDKNYWIPGRQSAAASSPVPPDGSDNIRGDADLMWLPGKYSFGENVYFGTARKSVYKAQTLSKEFRGTQRNNIFTPGPLKKGTYYWRIDTRVNERKYLKGNIWEFTVN